MLAITIFSSIVGDMLPITDTTPLIGKNKKEGFVAKLEEISKFVH